MESSDDSRFYVCLSCRSNSWLSLVIVASVTALFLVIDEGFVCLCVGGGTSVCGWLRYFEDHVNDIIRISVLEFLFNININY